jgi:hypothetical protein
VGDAMVSYSGGGVSRGGGGSSSLNAGGLKDGTRMRWMGRCTVDSLGPPICAACGRASCGIGVGIATSELPRERAIELSVGTKPVGEVRRTGAFGHPHSGTRVPPSAGSGEE